MLDMFFYAKWNAKMLYKLTDIVRLVIDNINVIK
jgi:hypothetical protein